METWATISLRFLQTIDNTGNSIAQTVIVNRFQSGFSGRRLALGEDRERLDSETVYPAALGVPQNRPEFCGFLCVIVR